MTLRKPLIAGFMLSIMAVGPALAQQGGKGGKGSSAALSASASSGVGATSASCATSGGATGASPGAAGSSTAASGAAGAAGATPSATSTAGGGGTIDGQTYAVRLRDLEERVDELKEQIRRSHTRLSLLSDSVLSGGVQGSRAEVVFQNDLSSAFRLTRALFVLDGAVQYNKADESGALSEQTTIPIFSGSIPPGDHTLQVLIQLQGNGYGVFSYLKGYKFEVRSTHSFTASEGKTMNLQVVAYEKGGVTTPLEERPAVRYFEKISSGLTGPSGGQAGPASSGAPSVTPSFSVSTGGK